MCSQKIKRFKNKVFEDERGYFTVNYNIGDLPEKINFIQDNESYSIKNTFRGMHFQSYPYSQTKLIRLIHGKILDFVMDIRPKSKNFKKLKIFELDSTKKESILIPRGFAHGFLVQSNFAIFHYKVDNYYSPTNSHGFNIFDKLKKLNFPLSKLKLSDNDKNYNNFQNFDYKLLKF